MFWRLRELIGLQKDGYDHKCGLFVAADGTNSGMQHLSAAYASPPERHDGQPDEADLTHAAG